MQPRAAKNRADPSRLGNNLGPRICSEIQVISFLLRLPSAQLVEDVERSYADEALEQADHHNCC